MSIVEHRFLFLVKARNEIAAFGTREFSKHALVVTHKPVHLESVSNALVRNTRAKCLQHALV